MSGQFWECPVRTRAFIAMTLTVRIFFQVKTIAMFLDWRFDEYVLQHLQHDIETKADHRKAAYNQSGWCYSNDERKSSDPTLEHAVSFTTVFELVYS